MVSGDEGWQPMEIAFRGGSWFQECVQQPALLVGTRDGESPGSQVLPGPRAVTPPRQRKPPHPGLVCSASDNMIEQGEMDICTNTLMRSRHRGRITAEIGKEFCKGSGIPARIFKSCDFQY